MTATPAEPRPDPWRRTSGIHRVSNRRTLAAIRALWYARDELARARDLAPQRVLPDSAIIAAAQALPQTTSALAALPVFSGPAQRRAAPHWMAALDAARQLSTADLPPTRLPASGPPPASRWQQRDPAAAARLAAARSALAELAERLNVPAENLLQPRLAREILWEPPTTADIRAALAAGGARPWQIELTAPLLAAACDAPGTRE